MAPAGGGLALVEALAAHAETVPDRIAIRYETTARRLIQDDAGRVNGVEATGASNRTVRLHGRAVVLASGGFEGNPEMLSRYLGPQSQFIRPVARGGYYNRGEGIRMALEIGAAPCGDYGSFHAQPVDPRSGQHEPVVLNYPYGILVNREGRRFVDEAPATVDASYEAASRRMMAQTEGIAFAITDARLDDVPNWQKSVRTDQPPVQAETPAALAHALGIDAEGLAQTLVRLQHRLPQRGRLHPPRPRRPQHRRPRAPQIQLGTPRGPAALPRMADHRRQLLHLRRAQDQPGSAGAQHRRRDHPRPLRRGRDRRPLLPHLHRLHLGDAGRGLRPHRRSRRGAQEPALAGVTVSQIALPAVFMRGGTSKGLFFHPRDLPAERAEWDALFLAALGSPDPHGRQLDGMGGGISSLSKVVVVSPSTQFPAWTSTISSARWRWTARWSTTAATAATSAPPWGPSPWTKGWCRRRTARPPSPSTTATWARPSRRASRSRTAARWWRAETVLDGVAGQGAPIQLSFLEPGGSVAGRLLPTGHARDMLDVPGAGPIEATLIDASTALVIVRAEALSLNGIELPDAIEAHPALTQRLEAIRRAGATAMGLAPETESVPKIGFVAPPADATTLSGARIAADAVDLVARVVSMGRPHRALPLTAALALAAAARIPGTLADKVARPNASTPVRLGHPSGVAEVAVELTATVPPHIARLGVTRTARRLMEGRVLVPAHRLAGVPDAG